MQRISLLIGLCLFFSVATRAQTTIPNGDFEHWTPSYRPWAVGWFDNNEYFFKLARIPQVQEVPGSVNSGIRLESFNWGTGDFPGGITNSVGISITDGGVPYSSAEIPTHLNGMYRYSILQNDSARIDMVLKKNGAVISHDTFYITGTQAGFAPFSFQLSPLTTAPDSIVFNAASGKYQFPSSGGVGSFLELDELYFSNQNTTIPLPNGDFDNWIIETVEDAQDWDRFFGGRKTSDSYSGNFASVVENFRDTVHGYVADPSISRQNLLVEDVDSLIGYYKYSTPGMDSGRIDIHLNVLTGTATTGYIVVKLPPVANYTRFSVPLNGHVDSAIIAFSFRSNVRRPIEGNTLWVDKLELTKRDKTAVGDMLPRKGFSIYPNPAKDILHIATTGSGKEISFTIQNAAGQVVRQGSFDGGSVYPVSVAGLPGGAYAFSIIQDGRVLVQKFIKE